MAQRRRQGLPHISRTAATRNRNRGHQHERAAAKPKSAPSRTLSRTPPPPPAPRRAQPVRLVEGPGARGETSAAQDGGEVASPVPGARTEAASSVLARTEAASSGRHSTTVRAEEQEPKTEEPGTGSGAAPSGALAADDESSDSEVSSAGSLEMEVLEDQTLAKLMEQWAHATPVKYEAPELEPHIACVRQANQRHPKAARHWLSQEAFLLKDVFSNAVIKPPRRPKP